jgi:hypothetical protein
MEDNLKTSSGCMSSSSKWNWVVVEEEVVVLEKRRVREC